MLEKLILKIANDKENIAAWTALLSQEQQHWFALCYRILGHADLAEDAIQNGLLYICEHANEFTPHKKNASMAAAAWLRRIMANSSLQILRKEQRLMKKHKDQALEDNMSIQKSPLSELEQEELAAVLKEEMNTLPEKYKVCMAIYYSTELNYKETAATLGKSVAVTRVYVYRAMQVLRKKLRKRGLSCTLVALHTCIQGMEVPRFKSLESIPVSSMDKIHAIESLGVLSLPVPAIFSPLLLVVVAPLLFLPLFFRAPTDQNDLSNTDELLTTKSHIQAERDNKLVEGPALPIIDILKSVFAAQIVFKSAAYNDGDQNGIGRYGFIDELCGERATMKTRKGQLSLLKNKLKILGPGVYTVHGFNVKICIPVSLSESVKTADDFISKFSGKENQAEKMFLVYAWPIDNHVNDRLFLIDQTGTLYTRKSNDLLYNLQQGPEWNSFFGGKGANWNGKIKAWPRYDVTKSEQKRQEKWFRDWLARDFEELTQLMLQTGGRPDPYMFNQYIDNKYPNLTRVEEVDGGIDFVEWTEYILKNADDFEDYRVPLVSFEPRNGKIRYRVLNKDAGKLLNRGMHNN